jgi:hypothetical protein
MTKFIKEATWREFQDSGLLWFVNRMIHLFGWSIVFEYEDETSEVPTRVYPAKNSCRGFDYETEDKGFANLTEHMKNNVDAWLKDVKE